MEDYRLGYNAYWLGYNFDESESVNWQSGWLDAENEDIYNGDYDDDYLS